MKKNLMANSFISSDGNSKPKYKQKIQNQSYACQFNVFINAYQLILTGCEQ